MFNPSIVVDLVNIEIPLYLSIAMGYGSCKLGIISYEQFYPGISGFDSRFTIPFLVFRMIATNNPYDMNQKLLLADTTCKVLILFVLCLGGCCWPTHRSVAWVSSLFNLATMSNSILIGSPLLLALYPGTESHMTTLIFMQSLLWFNVCIFILEIYTAMYENSEEFENVNKALQLKSQGIERESAGVLVGVVVENADMVREDESTNDLIIQKPTIPAQSFDSHFNKVNKLRSKLYGSLHGKGALPRVSMVNKRNLTQSEIGKRILKKVVTKFLWSSIAWGSLLGYFYSLISFKYFPGKPMPKLLKNWVDMLANCTLGLSMFMLGMNMGNADSVFPCGIWMTLFGAFVRFIVSPGVMALVSYVFGLQGDVFRFAVMQAMVPQSTLSFVWATQYNVHIDLFTTAYYSTPLLRKALASKLTCVALVT